MKLKYEKPMIGVEALSLYPSNAEDCDADVRDILSLRDLNVFSDSGCDTDYYNIFTAEEVDNEGDTVCYHSNILKAFSSN